MRIRGVPSAARVVVDRGWKNRALLLVTRMRMMMKKMKTKTLVVELAYDL